MNKDCLYDDYIAGVRSISRTEEDDNHEGMELEDEEQGEEQEPRLNGKVLYDIAGGTPHGRFAIGNGAVRAADVRAAAKKNRSHPSNSVSMQSMAREMARLRRADESMQRDNRAKDTALQQSDIATDLILVHIVIPYVHISTIDVFSYSELDTCFHCRDFIRS